MVEFSGVELSILEICLMLSVILLGITTIVTLGKVSALKSQLVSDHAFLTREINMVNQAAIGLGRRFSHTEKSLKKTSNVTNLEVVKEPAKSKASAFSDIQNNVLATQKAATRINSNSHQLKTKAERSLSSWINEHRSA